MKKLFFAVLVVVIVLVAVKLIKENQKEPPVTSVSVVESTVTIVDGNTMETIIDEDVWEDVDDDIEEYDDSTADDEETIIQE